MIYKRGKVWWYEFVFLGQRVRESSRSGSRTMAVAAERKRRHDLEESANGLRRRRRRIPLFSVAAREHLEWKRTEVQPSTLRIESKSIDHLLPVFGKVLLNDIQGDDIARYQKARVHDGAAGATVNLETGTLRAILRRHRLWEDIKPDYKPLPERDDVGVALSPDQEERLLAACRSSRSRLLYPAVVLALNTGLRRDELLKLRWTQVDLVNRKLTVGESKTAAGRGREVPLNSNAIQALIEWAAQFPNRKPIHAVFPTERVGAGGDTFDATISGTDPVKEVATLKTAWTTAREKSGVAVRWHDVRHTSVSRLLEQNVGLPMLGSLFGWSASTLARMAKRYGHVGIEAKRSAMEHLVARRAPEPSEDPDQGEVGANVIH